MVASRFQCQQHGGSHSSSRSGMGIASCRSMDVRGVGVWIALFSLCTTALDNRLRPGVDVDAGGTEAAGEVVWRGCVCGDLRCGCRVEQGMGVVEPVFLLFTVRCASAHNYRYCTYIQEPIGVSRWHQA